MTSAHHDESSFELRKGWNRESIPLCAFCAVMIAVGFTEPGSGFSIATWVFFGSVLLVIGGNAVRGNWFFRADAAGPVIRTSTIRGEQRIRLPWSQVQAVIVWKAQRNRWIGVIPTPGALPPTGPRWVRGAARLVAGDASQMCAALHGTRPDLPRLAGLLDDVAPHVALVDHSRSRPIIHRPGDGTNPFS
ncbi:hypothetical protein LO772_31840 [Yinghuangia sp. ASG 101]|uniref:hypothetical protein n=1 Tax=Yinghuangia sp. ASG 101 TaxID=2896848 RepID=UPI001E52B3CB|nr:hypothetical protein [Yinghuangia sp. ASG 101]UGQ11338.1 hypothetical protein LO772_31840 [Yinghuangia sp. ASG 101]